MNEAGVTSIDIIAGNHARPSVIDMAGVEALREKLGAARHVTISNDEARLLLQLLDAHVSWMSRNSAENRAKSTALVNFVSILGFGVSFGCISIAFMPTRPILSVVVGVAAMIVFKLALPWINSFDS